MKTKKKLIFKIALAMIMPLIVLGLFISKTYAYTLDTNGNLHSENLWTLDSSYSMSSDGYIANGNELLLNSGTYTFSFNFSGSNANCDFRLYTTYEDQAEFSRVFNIVNGLNTLTFTLNNSTTKILWYSNAVGTYSNLMLNIGSTALPYEPLGVWYASGNSSFLFNLFNNSNVELYNYNNPSNMNLIMSQNYFYNGGNLVTLDGVSNINNYITSNEDINFALKFKLNQPCNYILDFELNNTVMNVFVVLSNSVTGQQYTFESDFSNYNYHIVCDTGSNYYDTILYYPLRSPDYSYFSLFISSDTVSYNYGYNYGYNNGYTEGRYDGYQKGLNDGKSFGYNDGYNDGIAQDLESSGMKTLFNSILSFPVNMIKTVFDFNFMGINVASVIMFIVSIGIVIFVIKKFKE